MRIKIVTFSVVLSLLLASCNLPTASEAPPADNPPSVDMVGTSVALTLAARPIDPTDPTVTPILGFTDTPTVTPTNTSIPVACSPMVTTITDANVRAGPSTDYAIVGSLALGGTAVVAGRNDANTWWYIEFPYGAGGHAWIAGSVVTASCLPAVVAVIVPPPLPTARPTETNLPPVASVDLLASGMMVHPDPATRGTPTSVRVRVTNQGTVASGTFSVQWWSTWALVGCNWVVSSLAPGASKNLDCTYTYGGTSTYAIKVVVDSGNLIEETNEGNNTFESTLIVRPP